MTTAPRETIQLELSQEHKRELEAEAQRLNLSLSAYIIYLFLRDKISVEPERFNRIANEVFGRYGDVIRKLAQ